MCLGPIYTIELTENDMKKMLKYVCWIFDMVCDKGLQYYFEGREEEFIRKEKDRIMVLACVRFLHLVAGHGYRQTRTKADQDQQGP